MVPTRDNLGRIDGVQAIMEDVTDRKQAQIQLSESEERFRAVFETAQDLIFLKNRDLVFTPCESRLPQFLGPGGISGHRKDRGPDFHFTGGQLRHGPRGACAPWTGCGGELQFDNAWIPQDVSMCQGSDAKCLRGNDRYLWHCP